MGTRFTVGGIDFEALDYSVAEESTGLSLNDSSGGTGEVRVSVAKPTPDEIRDFPSPYPESVTLTPVLPGYYQDPEDFILTPPTEGGRAEYEVVEIPPSHRGATRALRFTVPPGSRALILPNGGARTLRDSGRDDLTQFESSSRLGLSELPQVQGRGPLYNGAWTLAASYIPRQIPETPPESAPRLTGGWPGDSWFVRILSVDQELGMNFYEYSPDSKYAVPYIRISNESGTSGPLVVDVVMAGVFALPEPTSTSDSVWSLLFSGFFDLPQFRSSWDSGTPGGLASRYTALTPAGSPWVRALAPKIFEGLDFLLEDSRYGKIPGKVETVSETDDSWEFTCITVMGLLNSRNVELPPVEAVASHVLRQFVRMSDSPWIPIYVEPELDQEILRLGRRGGDLWNLVKQFASGLNAEVSVVDGVIVLRRPRQLITEPGRYFSRSVDSSNQDASPGVVLETEFLTESETQSVIGVEVYPGGVVNEILPVISVPGGETVEVDVVLGAEISGLFVPPSSSIALRKVDVFDDLNTWVGEFNLNEGYLGSGASTDYIFTRKLWVRNKWYSRYFKLEDPEFSEPGFSLSIERIPSIDRTVRVSFRAPEVIDSDGRSRTFSLASISGGAQVNGVNLFSPWAMKVGSLKSSEFPSGYTKTSDDALDVIYSKNVSWTPDRISSAGYAAARRASGRYRTLSGFVDRLRPPYESNYYSAAPYSAAASFVGPRTYANVEDVYSSAVRPVNYSEIQKYWDQNYESSIKSWIFGNVSGARIWDEASNNFYRIRSATISPGGISLSAETDTVHGDVDPKYQAESLTYAGVTSRSRDYVPLSYEQASASGYLKDPANA